jgi:hypothetical protein
MSNGQGIYVLSEFPISTCLPISGLTVSVSRLGWGRGFALETEIAESHGKAKITQRVPQVGAHCVGRVLGVCLHNSLAF